MVSRSVACFGSEGAVGREYIQNEENVQQMLVISATPHVYIHLKGGLGIADSGKG